MLSFTRIARSYRTQKITERMQLLVTKKEVQYDHIAVDCTMAIGPALRMCAKERVEARRHKEVAKHVVSNIAHVLRLFRPKKTLALFMDGSEPIWKAKKNRTGLVTRKLETRLLRLPATPLISVIEEKVVGILPSKNFFPPEIVFSGPGTPGPVEQKVSAWALDLAQRATTKPTDSLALFGSAELYMNALALTPFTNVSSVVLSNKDFKQLSLVDMLDWLGIDEGLRAGGNVVVSKVRTDVAFLMVLCFGLGATEAAPLIGASFSVVMDKYLPRAATGQFLFEENGNELRLKVDELAIVLSACVRRPVVDREDARVMEFLDVALQSHALLCAGDVPNPHLAPAESLTQASYPPGCDVALVVGALRCAANKGRTLTASQSDLPPLSAGEFTVLSHSVGTSVEALLSQLVGHPPKPEICRTIASTTDVALALGKARDVLAYAHPEKPPRSLCLAPSLCWRQDEKTKWWKCWYVDVGALNKQETTRARRNADAAGGALVFAQGQDGAVTFDGEKWTPVVRYPLEAVAATSATAAPTTTPPVAAAFALAPPAAPKALRVTTWNVMFDRYSGKPTPLGMPGIDWCSPQRYPVICRVLEQQQADVIGLQEVETPFWEALAVCPWVRANYVLSCPRSGTAINPWGVLMLVHRRLKVTNLTQINVPAYANHFSLMPVVTVLLAHGPVNFCSMHLLAPFTKNNVTVRSAQDDVLRQKLAKNVTGDCVVMGDFNDWPTSEFTMPTESGFRDCWPIVCPGDPGKTMDETNVFAKLKIEEDFFGRSDKLFLRSKMLHPRSARMIGTRSVNDENGNLNAPAYLFPSDHYGITMDFAVSKSG